MPAPNTGNIKVVLDGRGPVTLHQGDYVATGGEGSIYRAHGFSVKLYTDTRKMRRDGMPEKVKLLAGLRHPFVMAPEGVVEDESGNPIGIYMPFAEGDPLPRIFTTAFRQREGFGDEDAKTLVDRMRETVQFAHGQSAIMVDANELNWITDRTGKKGPEPRAIDVDSWAIGRFGATVVMLSIRDWHTSGFTKASDWFSWGVVTFQIFTGIHPYRGTLAGYQPSELERRMKANASVFASGVRLNHVVRDFGKIPKPLRDWYEATFQKGERVQPPSPFDAGTQALTPAVIHRTVTSAMGSLIFDKIFESVGDPALRIWPCGAVLLTSGAVFDLKFKRQIATVTSREAEVVKVPDGWLVADWVSGALAFSFVDERTRVAQPLTFGLVGHKLVRYENRLFLVSGNELVELTLMNVGRPLLTIGPRTQVLTPQATKWFDGVGIQEAFGAKFLVLPFGDKACTIVRVKELDDIVPVSAKAGSRFVAVVGLDRSRGYRKIELSFSADYRKYTVWQNGTDNAELNVAILPKGVCAIITDDGELNIFVPSNGKLHKVNDRQITTDMQLANWDDTVVYIHDGAVWKVQMR